MKIVCQTRSRPLFLIWQIIALHFTLAKSNNNKTASAFKERKKGAISSPLRYDVWSLPLDSSQLPKDEHPELCHLNVLSK
jgi:hypothetical protein